MCIAHGRPIISASPQPVVNATAASSVGVGVLIVTMLGLYVVLSFAVMALLAISSRSGGRPLWLAILALGWGVGQLNILIEAWAFSVMPEAQVAFQLAVTLIVIAVMALLAIAVSGKWRHSDETPSELRLTWSNVLLIIAGYLVLYFGAGILVWPYVEHFYATRDIPSRPLVAALQAPRALIFLASAWLWLRTEPRHAPVVLGVAYAILGAIGPALPDNPFMPAEVRLAHAIETGLSNFLLGLLVGNVFRSRAVVGKPTPA